MPKSLLESKYFRKEEPDLPMSTMETPTLSAVSSQVISGENTQPIPEIPYVSPEETPVLPPPVAPEAPTIPPYEATPGEESLSSLIKEITATSGIAGEKEAYRAEQEKVAGLEAMRTSEADYTAQLRQLEADWANIENRMQLESEGRGRTVGGLAPLTMAEQRKISMRANTVSALLAATQGKITFAQSQIDRAVNAKYAQAEADRKAKIENLELLSKDPTLTVEQQKRANEQVTALNKQAEFEAEKKTDTNTIMNWAIQLASNPAIAQELMKMAQSDDPDLTTAFDLYSKNIPVEVAKPSYKYFTDEGGNVTQYNEATGESVSLGKVAKGTTSGLDYKFSSKDTGRLIATGLSQEDITNIQRDIKQYGIEKVKEGLSSDQGTALDQVLKGVTPTQAGKEEDETERTWADSKIKDTIKTSYESGYPKSDILITIEGSDMTQVDKDRAKEILDELVSDEMDEWLKKVQSDPDEYRVSEKGIYEIRYGWLPDKKVYTFD